MYDVQNVVKTFMVPNFNKTTKQKICIHNKRLKTIKVS